ncbi:MAG: hypothetical protein KDA32_03585, partial [Phycisphaerales bacterium]|nr:hypothetical protein [Phycisphaerales bacterium]
RCACGRRYRIRHATRDSAVTCPNCGRTITISDAELRLADGGDEVIQLQADVAMEEPYVLPLETGGLRLAERNARPGLTFRYRYTNPDAQISAAIGQQSFKGALNAVDERRAAAMGSWRPDDPAIADFVDAVFLARKPQNIVGVAFAALACCAMFGVIAATPIPGLARGLLTLFAVVLTCGYAVHMLWTTLFNSANYEDDIPIADTWNPFDDGVRPLIYIAFISVLCSVPALAVAWYASAIKRPELTFQLVFAAGWFFWPISVFAVALGDSIRALRPDFLLRCLVAIGPSYALWWGLVYAMLWGWYALFGMAAAQPWALAICPFFTFYCAYVLGRVLGLSYRRYQRRLPL